MEAEWGPGGQSGTGLKENIAMRLQTPNKDALGTWLFWSSCCPPAGDVRNVGERGPPRVLCASLFTPSVRHQPSQFRENHLLNENHPMSHVPKVLSTAVCSSENTPDFSGFSSHLQGDRDCGPGSWSHCSAHTHRPAPRPWAEKAAMARTTVLAPSTDRSLHGPATPVLAPALSPSEGVPSNSQPWSQKLVAVALGFF